MHKKLLALMMMSFFIIYTCIMVSAEESRYFYITDVTTGINYTIEVEGKKVEVFENGISAGKTVITNVTACSVYGGIITLFSADNLNEILSVYNYDYKNNTIDSYAVNINPRFNQYCYASMNGGTVCFTSEADSSVLHIYENGSLKSFDLPHIINQLMCIDEDCLLIFTTTNTMLYNGVEVKEISSLKLSVPVSCSCGEITDSSYRRFYYSNGYLYENVVTNETTTAQAASAQDTDSTPLPDNYIAKAGTTVFEIKKNLANREISEFTRFDGKIITSGKAGTGTKITFASGESTNVIIYGELTGEGNINSKDAKALLDALSEKEALSGDFLKSADVDFDGKITTKDALKISQMY